MTMQPLVPPFTFETARAKVRAAEDGWNSRDPDRVVLAYTEDCIWRNRSEFLAGREAIRAFLRGKWEREQDYRLVKSLWAFTADRIAVRFQYEWHDAVGAWHRSYGNEMWQFAGDGRMSRREASINDVAITTKERRFLWSAPGPRPADQPDIVDVR
jgi:nuclear transport factor 2 (NTF2) superfamily protein